VGVDVDGRERKEKGGNNSHHPSNKKGPDLDHGITTGSGVHQRLNIYNQGSLVGC